MMFVERVYDIKEFKELIDKNFRVHYKIEYTREMDGISHKLVFKLQGISKPYLVGNKESIHIVEYLKTYSLKWNDEEVIKTIEENPTLKTDDAINRLFERKIEEWLKIAEEFNATHGEFGGI